jgi:diguanylate cyclase (GGDEF)-like protein
MWTGNADLPDAVDAINSGGVFRLVLKPCAPNALEKCLESAIEEYERQAAERALALMDPLLQIASRRAFEQALIRVHAHATRHDRPYGLVMVDVDYFKRFNDTYGHIAGDRALISVADAIRRSCRTSDEVFRYGGEEMVLLLPDAEPRGLQVAGERFRARVQELRIPHTGSEHQCVTISLGAAICEAQSSDAAEAVLHRADQSLYQAKAAGRNRLMLWDSRRGLD